MDRSFPRPRKPVSNIMALSQECWLRVVSYFKDAKKAQQWLETPHPLLANTTPQLLLQRSKAHELLKFIIEHLKEESRNDHRW